MTRKTPKTTPPAVPPAVPQPTRTKLDALVDLLTRQDGASLDEMVAATGWQAHSVRGALSGSLKKGRGLSVLSQMTDAGRRYRIAADRPA